jgi:hypothetical protein
MNKSNIITATASYESPSKYVKGEINKSLYRYITMVPIA